MTVRQLMRKVRDTLQDTDGVYFTDSELLDLYNECKRYLSSKRLDNVKEVEISLIDGINTYTTEDVLRYISAKDSDGNNRPIYADYEKGTLDSSGIIITNYNEVYVNTPDSNIGITFRVIMFPEEDNLNDEIRSSDENAYKYYILSKCYEKDNDLEQFQKAQYFSNMFTETFKNVEKNTRVNYIDTTNTTVGYYF